MLTERPIPIPDPLRANLEKLLHSASDVPQLRRDQRGRAFTQAGLVILLPIAVFSVVILVMWLKGKPISGMVLMFSGAMAFFSLLILLHAWFSKEPGEIEYLQMQAKEARQVLDRGVLAHRTLLFGDKQIWIEHEHGVIVLVPADDRRTLYLDLSSVADDPRYPMYENKSIFRREWTWVQVPDFRAAGERKFKVGGASFEPKLLGHDDQLHAEIFEHFGSPGDGSIVDFRWNEVEAFVAERSKK